MAELAEWERRFVQERREAEIEARVEAEIARRVAAGELAPPKPPKPQPRRSQMSAKEMADWLTAHNGDTEAFARLPK